jgi:hypothetical protein
MKIGLLISLVTASLLPGQSPGNLRPAAFPSAQRPLLAAIGDRLQTSGKERITMTGTMQSPLVPGLPVPISIVLEYPGQLRINSGLRGDAIVFDGSTLSKLGGQLSALDTDLAEAIRSDSVEGFLLDQASNGPARHLGARFRIAGEQPSAGATGYCDLYQVFHRSKLKQSEATTKMFCFDTASKLLQFTIYRVGNDRYETRFSGWQKSGLQAFPTQISRFKNGTANVSLTLNGFQVGAALADAIFSRP